MIACPYCGNEIDWLSTTVAARLLGKTDSRIRQMVRAGRFPGAVRIEGIHKSGMWKIPASAVLPLLKEDE